jgi:DNA repair protein RadD
MMLTLRPYQEEAVAAVYGHLRGNDDNPCVVLPTGTGKSLVLGQIATDAVTIWNGRVLILAHVKELLEQNVDKIRRLCPEIGIGIYSAGLNRRDTDAPVLVAGIQSVYRRACELGKFDLIIVDEAHLVPVEGEGMYRSFLDDARVVNPKVRVIGLTATPYRLKGGEICHPDNILNRVCYEAGLREMIVQGYLCRLRSHGGRARADLSGVHVRGGEFVASEMEAAMDRYDLVRSACQEIVELTRDRQSVLIFATGVAHCQHVAAEIARISGQECGVITGDTASGERAEVIARFKGEEVADGLFSRKPPLKYLANVNVLTTGFDATNVDCIVLLRPTMSTGLYVQMVGRGTRIHPGKEDCLVLDYGGNVLRHGPVDAVRVNSQGNGDGEAPAKECPACGALVHAAYQTCPECGAAFPPPDRRPHDAKADGSAILSGEITDAEHEVHGVHYSVHTKRDADDSHPKTMRIEYRVGWQHYVSEWVCPEHSGWARQKFVQWWTERSRTPPPATADEAVRLAQDGVLAQTRRITVRAVSGEKYDRVVAYEVGEKPDYCPEPGWNDCQDEEPQPAPAMAWGDDDRIPF